jgi:hypothetical protein
MIAMFFITPPVLGENRAWTLQSTLSAEFGSGEACNDALVSHIGSAAQSTDTVSVFGWCMPKEPSDNQKSASLRIKTIRESIPGKSQFHFDAARTKAITQQAETEGLQKAEIGSCYYYVPAPVTEKGSGTGLTVSGVLGSCAKPQDLDPMRKPARR